MTPIALLGTVRVERWGGMDSTIGPCGGRRHQA